MLHNNCKYVTQPRTPFSSSFPALLTITLHIQFILSIFRFFISFGPVLLVIQSSFRLLRPVHPQINSSSSLYPPLDFNQRQRPSCHLISLHLPLNELLPLQRSLVRMPLRSVSPKIFPMSSFLIPKVGFLLFRFSFLNF